MFQIRLERIDAWLEETLHHLLRLGVAIAAVIVFAGGALYLARHGDRLPDYHVFHEQPENLRSLPGIVTDALSMRSRGAIQLGLVLLVAVPVARVAVVFLGFARERDRLYAFLALVVLALLLYNLRIVIP